MFLNHGVGPTMYQKRPHVVFIHNTYIITISLASI